MKYNIKLLTKDECIDYVQNYKDKIDFDEIAKYKIADYAKYNRYNTDEYQIFQNNEIYYVFCEEEMIYIPHIAIIRWIADKAVKEIIDKTIDETKSKYGKRDTKGVIV